MRQAGRSLPEYRALRERYSFFELGGTPELCTEVTLQPVRRLGVDAAVLSVADYEEFVAPYSARVLAAVDVPTIHFGTGTTHLLASMAAAGGDAIGLDWRVPLDEGWLAVGPERGVQGNLDPAVMLAPW